MRGDDKKAPPFERDDGPNAKRRKKTRKRRSNPQREALVREFISKQK